MEIKKGRQKRGGRITSCVFIIKCFFRIYRSNNTKKKCICILKIDFKIDRGSVF